MTAWAKRRFWTDVAIVANADGYLLTLDGRKVRTPAGEPLALPTRALAERVAAEWRAQKTAIDPASMPATRTANAAIDKVRGDHARIVEMIAAYGDSDLICYRAESPQELVAREAAAWDPLLEWAALRFDARLQICRGVIHRPQPAPALAALTGAVAALPSFELAALHDLVALSGSLVIGLAVTESVDAPELLWQHSRIDEDWQIAQWGADEEARAQAENRRQGFLEAAAFHACLRDPGACGQRSTA